MAHWVDSTGNYYIGDKKHGDDAAEVPQRPSPNHKWGGSSWSIDIPKMKLNIWAEIKLAAQNRLNDLDISQDKAEMRSALSPFRASLQNATTQGQIDTARDGAIAAIEALT